MWNVVTSGGLIVFTNDNKRLCNAYLNQALKKGSRPGFLRIVRAA